MLSFLRIELIGWLLVLFVHESSTVYSSTGVSEESFTSTENGTSLSAHGAQVAPSGRPLGGANL
jgi:hypothetical protein